MIENNALSRKILHFFLHKSKGGIMRYHFTPTKMAIVINKWKIMSVGKDVEKSEPFVYC